MESVNTLTKGPKIGSNFFKKWFYLFFSGNRHNVNSPFWQKMNLSGVVPTRHSFTTRSTACCWLVPTSKCSVGFVQRLYYWQGRANRPRLVLFTKLCLGFTIFLDTMQQSMTIIFWLFFHIMFSHRISSLHWWGFFLSLLLRRKYIPLLFLQQWTREARGEKS